MNILYIAHNGGIKNDGSTKSLISIMRHFSNVGYGVFLVVNTSEFLTNPIYFSLAKKVYNLKFISWIVPTNLSLLKFSRITIIRVFYALFIMRKTMKELRDIVLNEDIKIVHSNSSVINLGYKLSKKMKLQHVWHFREIAPQLDGRFPLFSNYKFKRFDNTNKIIFVSKSVKDYYSNLINQEFSVVIKDGVIVSRENAYIKSNKEFNLLIAGTISNNKGQLFAIKALIKLLKLEYNNIHLYIAGSGDITIIKKYLNCYSQNLHYLGQVSDISLLFKEIHIVLNCSKSEGLGLASIEAMNSSVPVIASDRGGNNEVVLNGYNGFIYKYGDVDEMVRKILVLYHDDILLREFGFKANMHIQNAYNLDEKLAEINQLYNTLIVQRGD